MKSQNNASTWLNRVLSINAFLLIMFSLPILSVQAQQWEKINPIPTGHNLNDVWGTSSNNVFAVGDNGTIVHYDGTQWQKMDSSTTLSLEDIWGSSENDVFAVGGNYRNGRIIHYDGSLWTEMYLSNQNLHAIWGNANNNVFAVGDDGLILHYDGSQWTKIESGTKFDLYGIWGSAKNDVFVVGDNNRWNHEENIILHYDGTEWRKMGNDTFAILYDIWGSASNDIFAVGEDGTILHYNGSSCWTAMGSGTTLSIKSIWGNASNNVFAMTQEGSTFHYDGNQWNQKVSVTSASISANGIWGTTENDLFAVGNKGASYHYDGSQWTEMSKNMITSDLINIWSNVENELFISSDYTNTAIHYDGNQWTTITEESSGNSIPPIRDSWTSSNHEMFAICGVCRLSNDYYTQKGIILHYNGINWTEMDKGKNHFLEGIWGSAKDDIFAVGELGAIFHYDGHQWTKMIRLTSSHLYDVWGSGGDNVFAVGKQGTILHYDGSQWTTMNSGTGQSLRAIWGTAENNVFAVGDKGRILHYDGNSWTVMVHSTKNLRHIWGNAENNVFAVGESGTILHYDGCRWTTMDSGTKLDIYDIQGNAEQGIIAVGEKGLFLHLTDIPDITTDENICEQLPINTEPVLDIKANFREKKRDGLRVLSTFRGETIRFTTTAIDKEGNDLQFSLVDTLNSECNKYWSINCQIPIGASIDPHTGVFTWTPYVGSHLLTVRVTEDGDQANRLSDEETIFIFVEDISVVEVPEPPFIYQFLKDIHTLTISEEKNNNCACQNPLLSLTKTKLSDWFLMMTRGILPTNFWIDEKSDSLVIIDNDSFPRIYHYDGNTWYSFMEQYLFMYGIWGNSANSLFVVGEDGVIFHYNGSEWMGLESNTHKDLYSIWGTSDNNIFAVGWDGTILHYDGSDWSKMASHSQETLLNIWGTSANDVFAVGINGTILHYDGFQWTTMNSATDKDLFGVLGCSGNDVYAVGSDGVILHYDGTQWQEKSVLGLLWDALWDKRSNSFHNEWTWIKKETANHLTVMESNTDLPLKSVWANSTQDVFAVGGIEYRNPKSIVLHYDGHQWTEMFNSDISLNAIWGSSENDVFVVGGKRWHNQGIIFHYDGSQWTEQFNTTTEIKTIYGNTGNDVFAKTQNDSILHYDGEQWITIENATIHHDGTHWTTTLPNNTEKNVNIQSDTSHVVETENFPYLIIEIFDKFGKTEDNVLGIDCYFNTKNDDYDYYDHYYYRHDYYNYYDICHYDGNQWTPSAIVGYRFDDITGVDNEAFIVGDNGLILHYDFNKEVPESTSEIMGNCVESNLEPVIIEETLNETPNPIEIEETLNETPNPIESETTIDTYGHPDTVNDDLELEIILEEEKQEPIEENSLTVIEPDILEPQLDEYPIVIKTMGTGIVTGDSIDCGSDCTAIYARGSSITLTATPENSNFSGWSGDCHGSNPSITLTVNAALNCIAMFDVMVPNRNLSIHLAGEGNGIVIAPIGLSDGIDCGETCVENYPDGTVIPLITQPETGSIFTGWIEEDCADELTITDDMSCTATFEQLPYYTLTVSTAEDNGTLITDPPGEACGENCTRYISGTEITLTAVPEPDYRLLNWAGDCEGTTASISFQLAGDMNCTAILKVLPPFERPDIDSEQTEIESDNNDQTLREDLEPLEAAIAVDVQGEIMRTEANFVGGISVDGGDTYETEVISSASEPVAIQSQIVIDPAHVGQVTDVLVVAAYQPVEESVQTRSTPAISYYMLDSEGHIFSWEGQFENLMSFQTINSSIPFIDVLIWDQPIGVTGKVNIYVGYRLMDGSVIYSPQTLDVMISE